MHIDRNNYPTLLHVSLLGCCVLISQTIIIRELLALFRGLESTIGLLLAAWLFWTGAGGLLSSRLTRLRSGVNADILRVTSATSAVLLPSTLLLIRFGRGMLASPPGSLPEFIPAMIFSVAVIAAPALISGMIYSAASLGLSKGPRSVRRGVTLVYIAEVAGSAVGAILFSLFMVGRMTHVAAMLWVSVFLILASGLFSRGKYSKGTMVVLILLVTGSLIKVKMIDRLSYGMVFGGYEKIMTAPSKYGELVAAGNDGSVSYFSGGSRLFSYPEPERAEETVHLPLLSHPRPGKVLLVGGSLGGVIEEVLSHPSVDTLHCVEIDDALAGMFDSYSWNGGDDIEASRRRADRIVVRSIADGRRYISRSTEKYDLIIVSPPPPLNLQWNRYYTREFFQKGSLLLRERGMLTISHDCAEEFIGPQLVRTLVTIHRTMNSVFPFVTVLPGSRAHFMGAAWIVDPDSILSRIGQRRLENDYISIAYLPERLSPGRISLLDAHLGVATDIMLNRDHHPVLTFQETILEALKRDRRMALFMESTSRLHRGFIPGMIILAGISILILRRRGGFGFTAVFLTGFSAFMIQMIILFMFQTESGVIYHSIIVLSALFMAGAASGALWIRWFPGDGFPDRRRLHLMISFSQILFILFAVAPSPLSEMLADRSMVYYFFSLLNGILTGGYYHLSVDRSHQGRIEKSPAIYYAADLFGACAGGIIAALVLLPLSGIYWTAAVILALNISAAILLPVRGRG